MSWEFTALGIATMRFLPRGEMYEIGPDTVPVPYPYCSNNEPPRTPPEEARYRTHT